VTSAAWSATLSASVGLAYVWRRDSAPVTADHIRSGRYAVNVGGKISPAEVSLKPLYDPANERVRA
jgi:4-methylaminobutanoate oxidase (formaldehyde-forming)